jgi:hypothetical protein
MFTVHPHDIDGGVIVPPRHNSATIQMFFASIFPELQEPTYYDIHIIEEDIPDSIIFQKKTPES